jgi:hypothetical protein
LSESSTYPLEAIVALIDHLDWFYAIYFAIGLAIFGLATYLWIAEYRRQRFPIRQGSPV